MIDQHAFLPPWWLRNKHIQSLYASVFNIRSTVDLKWEEFTLSDGDFVDLAWAGPAPRNAPVLILFHGLEGSVHSHYIQEMIELFIMRDWRIVVMHFRSCGGRLNRLPVSYNAAYTGDIKEVIDSISRRFPTCPLFAMGFSLGGSLLTRYLAHHPDAPLKAAIAVSMPFELAKSSDYLVSFYQRVLLRSLKRKIEFKLASGMKLPVTSKELKKITHLREFDRVITAPMYAYDSVDVYYEEASSRALLAGMTHPLLVLHAMDDPFVPSNSLPDAHELSPSIQMEISAYGGHMGFIQGGMPWKPSYWFAQRITTFFEPYLQAQSFDAPDLDCDEVLICTS